MMLLLLLFYLTLAVKTQEAQLILGPLNANYVTYFSIPFLVSTSNSTTPLVTCKITCPDGLVSRNVSRVTSPPSPILVRTPAYFGNCLASVEASGYLTAQQTIKVVNYTRCSTFNAPGTLVFNETTNATFSGDYTKQGPLGFLQLTSYKVSSPGNLVDSSKYSSQIIKDPEDSLIFFQSRCVSTYNVNVNISDLGTNSLSNCSAYNTDPISSLRPATPFSSLYGIPANGTYYVDTYISAPVFFGSAQLESAFVQVCLAANYIVLETLTSSLVPGSSLNFTAYLGLEQSMTATVAFTVDCGSSSTSASYEIGSTPQSFVIPTPAVQVGEKCYLVGLNGVPTQGYAATANITLIAAEPLQLVLSVPQTVVDASDALAFQVYVQGNQSLPAPVSLKLFCNDTLVGSSNFTATSSLQYWTVPDSAIGICQLNATSLNVVVGNSSTVNVSVFQQLNVASSLIGWTSGTNVTVNITSPNLEDKEITLTIACSIGSFSCQIDTYLYSNCSIPSTVNGVQCSLSTSNLPPFYLPIMSSYVNIAIDPAQIEEIIQQLSPASFLFFNEFLSEYEQPRRLKRFKPIRK